MSTTIELSSPLATIRVNPGQTIEAVFELHNRGPQDRQIQVTLKRQPKTPPWITLTGSDVVTVPAGTSTKISVTVSPSPGTEDTVHVVELLAADTSAPDDNRAESPTVQVYVRKPDKSNMPLLIAAGIGAVAVLGLLIGLVVWLTTGPSGLGGKCEAASDCKTGLSCVARTEGADKLCTAELGGACSDNADCVSTRCDSGSSQCVENIIAFGEPCTDESKCAQGSTCGKDKPRLCVLPNNKPCQRDSDCDSQFCESIRNICVTAPIHVPCQGNDDCFKQQVCVAMTVAGDKKSCLRDTDAPCGNDKDCASDWCFVKKCRAYTGKCQKRGDCRQNEACIQNFCALNNGQACVANLDCVSGLCAGGLCQRAPSRAPRCPTGSRYDWGPKKCVKVTSPMQVHTRARAEALIELQMKAVQKATKGKGK